MICSYEPPEARSLSTDFFAADFRKCDLWALGLTCWELITGGTPYYEDPRILAALTATDSGGVTPAASGISSGGGSQSRNESILRRLQTISHRIADIAQGSMKDSISSRTSPEIQAWCSTFLAGLLAEDPNKRSTEVLHLPIFHGNEYEQHSFLAIMPQSINLFVGTD